MAHLYYITHIDNIPSILELGILSHNIIEKNKKKKILGFLKSNGISHIPIYSEDIIMNRKGRNTPDKKSLWDYANLYFHARNPMLYRVICEKSINNIAVLAIDFNVINADGVFISKGNAASFLSDILPANNYKEMLREFKDVLRSEYWTDENGSKRKIMAECLVPEKINPQYIKTIYVADDKTRDRLEKISNTIPVISEPRMFFRNPLVTQISSNLSLFKGDMFFSRMHTITISVNVVGIMGKGLASRAKYQFPDTYVYYQDLCRNKTLKMGMPYIYKREKPLDSQLADEPATLKNGNGETWFFLFPTKNHWKENSDFSGIERGMQWLKENYRKEGIKSLAIPALGCGLGKLRWQDVGPMLCNYLVSLDIQVQLYLPTEKQIPDNLLTREFLLSEVK